MFNKCFDTLKITIVGFKLNVLFYNKILKLMKDKLMTGFTTAFQMVKSNPDLYGILVSEKKCWLLKKLQMCNNVWNIFVLVWKLLSITPGFNNFFYIKVLWINFNKRFGTHSAPPLFWQGNLAKVSKAQFG